MRIQCVKCGQCVGLGVGKCPKCGGTEFSASSAKPESPLMQLLRRTLEEVQKRKP